MLKDAFPGYQSLSRAQFDTAWQTGRFVLDTNVLLGLYRYNLATRNDLLSVLERISDRLWMPYQVGLEYNRKRLSVISGEKRAFDKAASSVDEYASKIRGVFSDKSRNPHPSEEVERSLASLSELAKKIVSEVQLLGRSLPDVHEEDVVRQSISDLYKGNIGKPPTSEWLTEATAVAKKRFDAGIPPGFEDAKKTEAFTDRGMIYDSQYGDVFVWIQILDQAKSENWCNGHNSNQHNSLGFDI